MSLMVLFRLHLVTALCFNLAHAKNGLSMPSFPMPVPPPLFEVWTGTRPMFGQSRFGPVNGNGQRPLSFPLQRTDVRAQVTSGVVHAKVTQIYRNDGNDCLQSRYIFPLPTRAAISAMSMRIGNRTVIGEIRTRYQAHQEFDAARDAGKSASLLYQERPNVFAMELANILPGETTEVVVEYAETLLPIDGVFAFSFPAVVGPRYGKGWEAGKDTSNLTTNVDLTIAPSCLGMDAALQMQVTNNTESTRSIVSGMNKDITVKFWFTERLVGAQFLVSRQGSEKFFSLAIQPPQRQLLTPGQIARREYLFILDVSGSMKGYPIDLSKSLMRKLLKDNVRAGDSFNIMLFAGGSAVLSENGNVKATAEEVASAQTWLDKNMQAGGSTNLLPALQRAFTLPRFHTAVSRTIVIMTDGYVTVEKEAFDLVRAKLGEGNVFVFGIGNSVNRYLIEGLARVGYGEPFVVTNKTEGAKMVVQLQRYIDTPVLTGLNLTFEGAFKPQEQEPPYLPDVFASRPIHAVGKWSGELSGRLNLKGRLADGELWEYSAELAQVQVAELPAVRLLWARSRIAILGDYGAVGNKAESEITALGLDYSLMTQYTSFVAIDSDPSGPAMCKVANLEGSKTDKASDPTKPKEEVGIRISLAGGAGGRLSTDGSHAVSISRKPSPLKTVLFLCILPLVGVATWMEQASA